MTYATVKVGSTRVAWPVVAACLAAAPMLGVFGVRALTHRPSPSSARGSEGVASSGQFMAPSLCTKLSPEAVALQMTLDSECNQPFGPSPMVAKAPPKPQIPKEPVVSKPAEPPPAAPVNPPAAIPALTLTSILAGAGSGASPVAIINGKLRRVNDHVGNGFSIAAIDSAAGTVEVANSEGIRATLQLKNARGND